MKKILVVTLLNCVYLICNSQFHERIYFNNLYNQNTWSSALSIIEFNSSYLIAGITSDSIVGYKNIVILKLSLDGNLTFWKEFRVNNSDHYPGFPGSFHSYNDSSFILGGSHDVGNESCGLYINFNLNFDTINSDSYCSYVENFLFFGHCNIAEADKIIFTGYERQMNLTGNVFLLKSDYDGNELWRKSFSFETTGEGQKVIMTSDNGFVISGYTYTPTNSYSGNALMIKTDSLGNMEWYKELGNPEYSDGYGSVTIAPDGNYVFGYTHAVYQGPPYPVPESYCKIKFIKFDQNGDTIWERIYGNAFQINMLRNIITLHDGSFVAVGYANSDTINGVFQGWLFKINQYGDSVWYRDYRHYSSSSLDYLYDVYETSDHSLIACGESSYAEPGPDAIQRMWILKLDSAGCEEAGCDSTVGVSEEHGCMGAWGHGGLEIWPNPARDIVRVSYFNHQKVGQLASWQLDKNIIEIYNVFGREVHSEIFSSPMEGGGREGGRQDWTVDVSALPPGIYFISVMQDGNRVAGGKFVVFH